MAAAGLVASQPPLRRQQLGRRSPRHNAQPVLIAPASAAWRTFPSGARPAGPGCRPLAIRPTGPPGCAD